MTVSGREAISRVVVFVQHGEGHDLTSSDANFERIESVHLALLLLLGELPQTAVKRFGWQLCAG